MDNGVGLPADVQWTRKVMSGVRQRVQTLGASVQWQQGPGGQGCVAVLRLQLGEPHSKLSQALGGTSLGGSTM